MKQSFTLPELVLVAASRGFAGIGVGLLIADRFKRDQRVAAGWALFIAGAIISIPVAVAMLRKPAGAEAGVPELVRA